MGGTLQALRPVARHSGLPGPWWALEQSYHSPQEMLHGQVVRQQLLVAQGLQQLLQRAKPQEVGAPR